jgi:hypothetical protein
VLCISISFWAPFPGATRARETTPKASEGFVEGTQRIRVGFRGLFGEEPAKQTERSCEAWEFSRSRAQERDAQKDEMQTNPQRWMKQPDGK